jgi:DNA-binding beta-propeller fold protein YncE
VSGSMVPVDIPADSDAPFGLVTRGANAYVTIAHSDEITVIRSGQLVDLVRTGTPTGSGQHAPCWLALLGPYLYSANSPSHTLSRFIATGASIVPDEAVAARTNGAPTDIAAAGKRLAVIDSDGVVSRLTQFVVEDDGTLAPAATTVIASAAANGVAIITR